MKQQTFGLVAALVVCLAVTQIDCSFVPVLSRLGSKLDSNNLGEHVDTASFKDELTISLSKVNQLTLVLIKTASSLTSADYVQEMRRFELESDVLFQPQVNDAYTTLISYLASHPSVKVEKVVVDDVNDGLLKLVLIL